MNLETRGSLVSAAGLLYDDIPPHRFG